MANSTDEFTQFIESLDPGLKQEVYRKMYAYTKSCIQFFSVQNNSNFTEWVCPLLKSRLFIENMAIYREMEEIEAIYFLESGEVAYVLPRFQNKVFITVTESETFGTADIAFRFLELEKLRLNGENSTQYQSVLNSPMLQKFTTMTKKRAII